MFAENNLPLPEDLKLGQCVRVKYEWNGIKRELDGQPACGNGKGISFRPIKQNFTNYASRCSNTTVENCRRICGESKGILKVEGTGYNCYTMKAAKALCLKVEVNDEKLKLTGGCYFNDQFEYYGTLEPSSMFKYGRSVDHFDPGHDVEGPRRPLHQSLRSVA